MRDLAPLSSLRSPERPAPRPDPASSREPAAGADERGNGFEKALSAVPGGEAGPAQAATTAPGTPESKARTPDAQAEKPGDEEVPPEAPVLGGPAPLPLPTILAAQAALAAGAPGVAVPPGEAAAGESVGETVLAPGEPASPGAGLPIPLLPGALPASVAETAPEARPGTGLGAAAPSTATMPAGMEAVASTSGPRSGAPAPGMSPGEGTPVPTAEAEVEGEASVEPSPTREPVAKAPAVETPAAPPPLPPGLESLAQATAAPAQGPSAATAAATAGAPPGQPPVPVFTAVPLGAVPMEIGLKSLAGLNSFEIRLDPVELGRIDVRLDIDETGEVKARLTVDRVETLALLQRDAKVLERAFEQAGLKTGDGSVDLQLRDPGGGRGESGGRDRDDASGRSPHRSAGGSDDRLPAPPPTPARTLWRGSAGIDLRI